MDVRSSPRIVMHRNQFVKRFVIYETRLIKNAPATLPATPRTSHIRSCIPCSTVQWKRLPSVASHQIKVSLNTPIVGAFAFKQTNALYHTRLNEPLRARDHLLARSQSSSRFTSQFLNLEFDCIVVQKRIVAKLPILDSEQQAISFMRKGA